MAAGAQTGNYRPDVWRNVQLNEGKFVVGGLSGQTNFYTTMSGLARSEFSAVRLWEGLQVMPHETRGFRSSVGIYEVGADTQAAFGITYNNSAWGS